MGWIRKSVFALICGLVLMVLGLAATLWIAALRSVPETSGEASLPGLKAPATILTDSNGIPTIRAGSMRDAYRVLGYLHARDRLWQMETMRRVGSGRLSEILGPATVRVDRTMRELGVPNQAAGQAALLNADQRADFEAYAQGVNAFIESAETLPIEFQLTLHNPEPWEITDSFIWGRLMALQLSENAFMESFRADLIAHVGTERAAALIPQNDGSPTSLNEDNQNSWLEGYDASNAWVLSGERTQTGAPILANDPHLGIGMPGQWYLVRIETPELTLTGVTAPGVPLHILGHNEQIAWGMTTTHADTQDTIYLSPEQLATATETTEIIRVRFGEDVTLTLKESELGPVLTSLGEPARAFLWVGSALDQNTPLALYQMNRARSWDEFLEATTLFVDPMQNIFYADRSGTIGMKVAGSLPIRQPGLDGLTPLSGSDIGTPWIGQVSSAGLPGLVNPDTGVILNANNRVVSAVYPHLISHDFKSSYRVERLIEMLAETTENHSLEDSTAIQMDTLSVAARELVPYLLTANPNTPLSAKALDILKSWDFRMDRNQAAPAIYAVYLNEVVRMLVEDDLGPELFETYWRSRPDFVHLAFSGDPSWCDNSLTDPRETCQDLLSTALERAVHILANELDDDAADWRWGNLHQAPMRHQLLNRIPGLSNLGNRQFETDGGDHTLNRGHGLSGASTPQFDHIVGASYRAIYDLSDLDNSLFALAGGQSGNPFSPFYGSLLDDWRDGRYFRIPGRGEDIAPPGGTLLRLHP